MTEPAARKQKKETPWYIEIPLVVVMTFILIALVQTFIGRLYVIPSQSMEPTLHGCPGCTGDRIYVDKIAYRMSEPEPGDVVVFKAPDSWNSSFRQQDTGGLLRGLQNLGSYVGLTSPDENDMVKRIIATGGQEVQCLAGDEGIKVNGQLVDSSYQLQPPTYPANPQRGSEACSGDYFGPVKVPEGNYFVMGDNRTNSADSRFHLADELQGTVPRDNIVGKVQAIVLPFDRIGAVEDLDIQ
ncbi:signal peptidase I [Corynebacterium sp. H128]|uniref:signal peptidase I n=1 Tax=unclassified Corynebacterium TaxID=2624378 RepID=UPI0030B394B3